MKCRRARKLILSYAELDPSQKKRLDEHLLSCPHCSIEFSFCLKSIKLFKEAASFEESQGFWKGYRVNLQRRIEPSPFWSRIWTKVEGISSLFRTPLLGPVPAYVFSFALIAVLTLGLYRSLPASKSVGVFQNNLVANEGELRGAFDDGEHTIYVVAVGNQ
jgi:hypothetical protein